MNANNKIHSRREFLYQAAIIGAGALLPTAIFSTQIKGSEKQTKNKEETIKIKITVGGKEITANLTDKASTRDFISLFPLILTLEDYNHTEKISSLPKKLSVTDEPSGYNPSIGDIAFYVPWGNLCIFYQDFGYSSGLVFLGKIEGGTEAFNISGSMSATFEVIQ